MGRRRIRRKRSSRGEGKARLFLEGAKEKTKQDGEGTKEGAIKLAAGTNKGASQGAKEAKEEVINKEGGAKEEAQKK